MDGARKKLWTAGAAGLVAVGLIGGMAISGGDDEQKVEMVPVSDEVDETTTTTTEAVTTTSTTTVAPTTTQAPVTTQASVVVATVPPTSLPERPTVEDQVADHEERITDLEATTTTTTTVQAPPTTGMPWDYPGYEPPAP